MIKTLLDLFWAFASVGAVTFGGGYAMLAMFKTELVDKKGWVSEDELLDYYAIGQCTPGVIAVNTSTFVGYKRAGVAGALAATLGIVTPSVIIILVIASVLTRFMDSVYVAHALSGIRAVVCALMMNTVIAMGKKSIIDLYGVLAFLAALAAAFLLGVPSVLIVVACGLLGVCITLVKEREKK